MKGLKVEEQILGILGKHPRIIQLKGKHEDGILLEYLPHRSVERHLRSHAHTLVEQRLRWGRQAAEGLAYIHTKNVLHCDVSVGNLLLGADLSIKLCDFQGRLLHTDGNVALDGAAAESAMSLDQNYHKDCGLSASATLPASAIEVSKLLRFTNT